MIPDGLIPVIESEAGRFEFSSSEGHLNFITFLFQSNMIWFCARCGLWHISSRGQKLGLEEFLLHVTQAT